MPAQFLPHSRITVSIVSHGQLALIVPLLEQLAAHCADVIAQVVLTRNIPEPDLLAGRTWPFALVQLDNDQPKGFGANHNAAFTHCDSDWFLVLNPDIRLSDDVLTPLLGQALPRSGLLAPRVFEPNKTRPEPHRALITPREILRRHRADYVPPDHPAWLPGLFMLYRREAYAQIHGFDERYFMYGEDFDICARLRLAGWHIQIADDLQVRHEAQRASHRSRRHLYWHISSLCRVWLSSVFWRYRALLQREALDSAPR